jgi:hypothetical protein
MSERIRCTAFEAATTHRDLIGKTHLVRYLGDKGRGGWSYYSMIKVPVSSTKVRVQRIYCGEAMTSWWESTAKVELVPIEDVPEEQLPDNFKEAQ